MKSFFGKFLLVTVSLIAGLVLIEISLSAIGNYRASLQDESNTIHAADANKFRILALGESTTAERWNSKPEKAWPGQLEEKLNEKTAGQFRVYNKGRAATSSAYILKHLPEWLDTFRPHMVIAMIGVNDSFSMEYFHSEDHWWSQLHLVKLYEWYRQSWKSSPWPSPEESERLALDLPLPMKPDEVANFKKNVEEFSRKSSHEWFVLRHVSRRILLSIMFEQTASDSKLKNELLNLGNEWARKAFHKQPLDNYLFQMVGWYAKYRNDYESLLTDLDFAISEGLEADPAFLPAFPQNDERFGKRLRQWGIYINHAESGYDLLLRNYRKIADLIFQKKIQLVIMSYPTMPIAPFRNIFVEKPEKISGIFIPFKFKEPVSLDPRYRNLVWVSHENFNDLMKQKDRSYYFYDHFTNLSGGNVGHTTPEGHRIIVENILEALPSFRGNR